MAKKIEEVQVNQTVTAISIPLSDIELMIMKPYLEQAASASRSLQSAKDALEAIAKTAACRAGAPPEQRFALDLAGKRLVPSG